MTGVLGTSFEELFRLGLMPLFDFADGFMHVREPGNDERVGVRRMDSLPFVHMSTGGSSEGATLQHS